MGLIRARKTNAYPPQSRPPTEIMRDSMRSIFLSEADLCGKSVDAMRTVGCIFYFFRVFCAAYLPSHNQALCATDQGKSHATSAANALKTPLFSVFPPLFDTKLVFCIIINRYVFPHQVRGFFAAFPAFTYKKRQPTEHSIRFCIRASARWLEILISFRFLFSVISQIV